MYNHFGKRDIGLQVESLKSIISAKHILGDEPKENWNWLKPFLIRANQRVPMEPFKRVVMISTNRYIFNN